MATQPLVGVRILDLTQALAGPFATMILADMGAEVIKIEPPSGDLTRNTPPHMVKDTSLYFVTNNRNKQGVVLDLKLPAALEAFYDLCRVSDVVIYNFSEGVADRLKIDADTLRGINPSLVVCNMTGYGRRGPDARRKAVDPIIQSLAGAVSITGLPGSEPVRAGIATADLSTGLYAAIGVLGALHARQRTGQGSGVEASLFHSQLSLLNYVGTYCAWSGEVPGPVGSGHPGTVPSQVFRTSDGWITIDAGFDRHFRTLCDVLERPDLAQDERFINRLARARNRQELLPSIIELIEKRTTDQWIEILDGAGIPCGKVNNVKEALESAQSREYRSVRETSYQGVPVKVLATPLWFDGEVEHPVRSPPALGEHTETVLRELLGYDERAIRAVASEGATEP
jgi:crotonobetainyl-CoA:carnitine CoA-transferase CaiB-like acyl-CoA transferase